MGHVHPDLVGDRVYGGRRRVPARALGAPAQAAVAGFGRQALHAASLGFAHPLSGAPLRFETPPPPDMAALLAALRADGAG